MGRFFHQKVCVDRLRGKLLLKNKIHENLPSGIVERH
jgi:hypothetical protein